MIQAGAEGRVHTSHLPIRERQAKVSKKVKNFQERAYIFVVVVGVRFFGLLQAIGLASCLLL